jgi:hypothetical protein
LRAKVKQRNRTDRGSRHFFQSTRTQCSPKPKRSI